MEPWKTEDIVNEVLVGVSPGAVPVGNFLSIRMIGDGISFQIEATTPGGGVDQTILVMKQDVQVLADVLQAIADAFSKPEEKPTELSAKESKSSRK